MTIKMNGGHKMRAWIASTTKALEKAKTVDVGFFKKSTYTDGTPVAAVAAAQEFGHNTIPARSFMRTTIAEKSSQWGKAAGVFLRSAHYDTHDTLLQMGMTISGEMKEKIASITEPPLSPETINQKRRNNSEMPEKPLIDTGHLAQSLTCQVDKPDD